MQKLFGEHKKPFIIAEMSGNHNQSLDRALRIVELAAKAGADAIKLQTYTADTMTIDCKNEDFFIEDKNSLWQGTYLYNLYQTAFTPWDWHKPIFDFCKQLGIVGFSTPFDASSVDFLQSLDVPFYKIASFENIDLPLIKKIAQTGKPIIASTGMTTVSELDELVRTVKSCGNSELVLLKCTSNYPATPEGSNLLTIPHMKQLFNCEIGLSDHTLGIGVSVASVALGACVIERHFTTARSDGGVDSAFSLEPQELAQLVLETDRAWQALGKVNYDVTEQEKKSLRFRRSLYITKDLKKGDSITPDNMRSIRPGFGLAPKYYEAILGKKLSCDVKRGTAVSWDLFSL